MTSTFASNFLCWKWQTYKSQSSDNSFYVHLNGDRESLAVSGFCWLLSMYLLLSHSTYGLVVKYLLCIIVISSTKSRFFLLQVLIHCLPLYIFFLKIDARKKSFAHPVYSFKTLNCTEKRLKWTKIAGAWIKLRNVFPHWTTGTQWKCASAGEANRIRLM